jgi:lysophospholipase L1-like esterase
VDNCSQIPYQRVPFEFCLPRFAAALDKGWVKIVAIGSSTTAGEGGIAPYPSRLLSLLRSRYGDKFDVINRGVGGEEAPKERGRFETDVYPQNPDLVIWQVGTNAVWQRPDPNNKPPSFNETTDAIAGGIDDLKQRTRADIVLMDLQYVPAVVTPAKIDTTIAMVEAIGRIAHEKKVSVFRRFALMKGWHKVEKIAFDRMVDPGDGERLHASEWTTNRVSQELTDAIGDAAAAARSCAATEKSPPSQ